MANPLSHLFEPVSLGKITVKNRIVMAPMTRNFSKGGIPDADVAAYYQRRAQVGLIITEGTIVGHKGANGYPNVPFFYGEEALAGWQKVVDSVHRAGGMIFPQIWHVGMVRRLGMEPYPEEPAYGPIALVKGGKVLVKEMTQSDIQDVVKAFAESAFHAYKMGFDGVEVHGAHGYLIDQFFSPVMNQRADEYGGSLENRCRFGREIIEAIRIATSESFPICLRFSQWKQQDCQAKIVTTPQEFESFLKIFATAGVDIFHCSTRRLWEPGFADSPLTLAGWTKKLSGMPTIAVGSVGIDEDFITTFRPDFNHKSSPASLEHLVALLDNKEFDLVAVGRGLIANPDWVELVQSGAVEKIQPFHKGLLASLT